MDKKLVFPAIKGEESIPSNLIAKGGFEMGGVGAFDSKYITLFQSGGVYPSRPPNTGQSFVFSLVSICPAGPTHYSV